MKIMNINEPLREIGKRLDTELFSRGIVRSRSAAADLIKRGKVRVNGKVITKTSTDVFVADKLEADQNVSFVSRAGEKLAHALKEWKIDVNGLYAIDIGSSTGGFTDCLLQNGVKNVLAIDVGTDQLAQSLREDIRVEVRENTDVRKLNQSDIPVPADMATIDVSFISLEHILPKVFSLIKKGGFVIALVKPQFEVGKEIADKNKGIITDSNEQKTALDSVKKFAKSAGFKVKNETISPLEGEKGNKEFLLYLTK